MPSSGKLNLQIVWDGNVVRNVEVKSTRPQAYRLLKGKLTKDALQMVPLLYSVCGKAQHAAAIAATTAAKGIELQPDGTLEREVTCEAMQEHLWRLLLDWPKLLGLQIHQQQFVHWHGALKEISNGRGSAENLQVELHQVLLGITAAEWAQIDNYVKLEEWQSRGQGLLAPVIATLNLEEEKFEFAEKIEQAELMPNWSASEILQMFKDNFDNQFAAIPQYEGKPMETGALAQNQNASLLRDVINKHPTRVQARLIARLVALLDSAESLVTGNLSDVLQSISASNSSGLSMVKTARGMLLHHVRIEADRIAEYLTVAPTEWNFHPQGALANGLNGQKENNAERLLRTVKALVLSLDPCVEYEIEISHA
jgi:coenzyme F420-reducing hydrogenase alpha subunit